MNNLDKMKATLIDRMQKMSVQQFENLVTVLNSANYVYEFNEPIDANGLFNCEDCEKYFGYCEVEEDSSVCLKRFHEYEMEKCKKTKL